MIFGGECVVWGGPMLVALRVGMLRRTDAVTVAGTGAVVIADAGVSTSNRLGTKCHGRCERVMVVAVWISIFGPTYSLSATQSTYPAAKSHQQQRMMYVNPQRNSPAHNHRLTRTPRGLPASYTRLARNDLVAADLARRALLAAPRCPLRAAHHRGNRHRGDQSLGVNMMGRVAG